MYHGLSYVAARIMYVATVFQNAHKATQTGGGLPGERERLPGIVMFCAINTNRNLV